MIACLLCSPIFLLIKLTRIDFLKLTSSLSLMIFHCLCLSPFLPHTDPLLFSCMCVGGEGKVGKVVDIRGWDTESGRSVASVTWSNGTTNVYRMGHKGKVDLKYVSDGQGGFYYKDHLPKLGKKDCFKSMYALKQESKLFISLVVHLVFLTYQ